jgi:hypothetical protein
MPPRSTAPAEAKPVKTQISAHSAPPGPAMPSHAIQSSSFARYNGPITRSRTAHALTEQHSIDSIPPEVLSTIFILTLASDEQIVKRSSVGWTNPLPLCAVSSLWRTLALATPKLWSRVFVYVPGDKSKEARLVPWIKRSGSLPLTLFILYCGPFRNGSGIGNSVVKVLNRYASRWETLYVQYHNEYDERRENTPELLRGDKWSSLQHMHGVKPHDTITCAQLTHLQFYRHCEVSYAQVVGIFRGCPRLVWLSLIINVAQEFINIPASPIILHDLSFVSFSANHFSPIYQLVSLPSLRELICRQTDPSLAFESLGSLLSLLTRSACTLDKLEMKGVQSLPRDLVQLLTHRSCHFLTSLGVCHHVIYAGVPINDEVLQTLTLHHDNSACTHLKFLSLHCRAAQCSQSALIKLVESRICSCTTSQPQDGLLYLQIVSYPEPGSEPQEWPDEAIKRSEMECESRDDYRGLCLRRRGFRGSVPDSFGT